MKKLCCFIAVVILCCVFSVSAFTVDNYGGYNIPADIDVNGNFIKCAEKPILVNNVAYIPLRAFSDAIGGVIKWNATENAAEMTKDGHSFVFYPGKDYCRIDGIEKKYSSVLYKDLTFIPVRAVSEVLGYAVKWDDFYMTVKVEAPGVVVPENCKDKSYTYEDILYLGRIVQVESGYQQFKVKLGVAGTVVNRVRSAKFPNNVKAVIFDTRYGVQFPPAHTDKINNTPSKGSVIAAKCALGGVNIVGNSLYFIDASNAASSWAHNNRPHYATICDMSFYE